MQNGGLRAAVFVCAVLEQFLHLPEPRAAIGWSAHEARRAVFAHQGLDALARLVARAVK